MAAKAAESIMDTLGSALEAHQDVFDAAKGSLADLPEKRGSLPLTFTEATAYIQHKEDEKRRREAKKDRQKQRSGPPPAETIPGLIPGPPDSSPFWLVTEGYFREVTKEDVAALLPTVSNPLEDPIFLIPPSGRHYSSHDDFEPAALVPLSTLQKGSRPPAHAPLMKDRVSELKAQAAAEAAPLREHESDAPDEAASSLALDDTQRKSRRLVAKAEKQAEARHFDDEYAFGSDSPRGTSCLLQSCSADDFTSLSSQAVALFGDSLEQAAEEMGLQPAMLEQALIAHPVDGVQRPFSETLHSALQAWLRQKASDVLPQRAPLARPLPQIEAPEAILEQSKPEEGNLASSEAPQLQSDAQQQGEPGLVRVSEQDVQLHQSAAGAEKLQMACQAADDLQRTELLHAGVMSGKSAADRQQESLQVATDRPEASGKEQELVKQKTLSPPQSAASAGDEVRAEQSQPPLNNGLEVETGSDPSQPMQIDSAAAQTEALPDVKPSMAPAASLADQAQAAADAREQSHAPACGEAPLAGLLPEPQPAQVPETEQLALQPGDTLPPSSAAAASAPKPAKPQTESNEPPFSCLPCSMISTTPDQAAKLGTWAAWQEALKAAPATVLDAAADDETLHPYTRRLLACPLSQYVLQPDGQDGGRVSMPMSGINTPAGVTPSVSGEDGSAFTASKDRADGDVQSAHTPRQPFSFTTLPSHLSTGGDSAVAHDVAHEAIPKDEQLQSESAAYFRGDPAQMAERATSDSLAGPSQSRGATSSGPGPDGGPHMGAFFHQLSRGGAGSKRQGEQSSRGAKRGQAKGAPERSEAKQRGQTALAVQGAIAAGQHEGSLEQQWEQLAAASDDLAAAPDDEVLAEILAVQAELLQQVAVNRFRLRGVVKSLLQDMPAQREAGKRREEGIEFARQYHNRIKALKKGAKREKREAAARDAMKEAQAAMPSSPRQVANRMRGDRGTTPMRTWQGEMVDVLASRKGEEEALCAICADGTSVDPNVIVFCERCDMAVHQLCYGIEQVPSGEWLCWPCRLHEESLRAAAVPQKDIRPPRWEMHSSTEGRKILEGGSLAAECMLCPIRQGAFRQTVDTHEWVHQVCAMWTPDVRARRGPDLDVVEGVSSVSPDRWGSLCSVCGSSKGVVLRCSAGHCTLPFHALCGRNAGFYLAARGEPGEKPVYRAYCALHSDAQQRKDLEVAAEGGALKKKDSKKVAKEEAAQQQALRALANREAHWDTLERARLELEALRMLLERVGRREKVKKQLVLATWDAMKLRAAKPLPGWQACLEAEALLPIGARLAARQGQLLGSTPAHAGPAAQMPPSSAFSGAAPAFGHASSAPKTLPGRRLNSDAKHDTGSLLHLPGLSTLLNEGLPDPNNGSLQDPLESLPMDSASLPPVLDQDAASAAIKAPAEPLEPLGEPAAQEDTKEECDRDQSGVEEAAAEGASAADNPSDPPPSKAPPKRKRSVTNIEPPKGKRAKKSEAKATDFDEAADRALESSPGTRSRSLRSSGEQVDRNCLMTSSEAAAANSRMPKGFRYMPVQPTRKSSRPGSAKGGR